jgi:MSHA biogenesis protein MshN
MSIINQMLRDLDAREASEKERAGLPMQLRPLPPARQNRNQQVRILGMGVAIGLLIAGAISLMRGGEAPPSPPVAAVPAVAANVPAPAPVPEDTKPLVSAENNVLPLPAQKAKPVSEAEQPPAARTATQHRSESDIKPISPAPAASQRAEPAKRISPVPAAQIAKTEEVGTGEARIDKQARSNPGGRSREMAEGEYRKGMQAVKLGDYGAAQPLFQRTLELDPGYARARQALLSVLVRSKQWNEARKAAEEGLALDPSQSGWVVILARLQFEQGDIPAAIATLERYAAHAKGDADYQGLFAYLLQKQERPAEAVEHFRAALAQRPYEGRWWFGLGLALESTGKPVEAKEAYAKAREAGKLPPDMVVVIEQKLK